MASPASLLTLQGPGGWTHVSRVRPSAPVQQCGLLVRPSRVGARVCALLPTCFPGPQLGTHPTLSHLLSPCPQAREHPVRPRQVSESALTPEHDP